MANEFQPLISQVAKKYRIPENVLTALVRQESGFNPRAVSSAGAQGLAQLMPATARGLGVRDPFDPQENLEGGARYLRQQLDAFGSLPLALAAYNAGPGNVRKAGNRIPAFRETQNYVKSILGSLGGGGVDTSLSSGAGANGQNSGLPAATGRSPSRRAALQFILGDDFAPFLSESFAPPAAASAPTIAAPPDRGRKTGSVKGLDPTFEQRLAALIAAVRAQGGNLTVTSGFRDVAHQRRLWQQALKKYGSAAKARKWVAPPGKSRHNMGLAADLRGDLELAHKLAPQFGLHFPLKHEEWHVERVGSR